MDVIARTDSSPGTAGSESSPGGPTPDPSVKEQESKAQPRPRISVVTPVFNQASYVAQTIESVLSQDIQGIEYIVLDGGSTDGTQDVIRQYQKHLSHWESEPDGGQVPALSKGFKLASGHILCWLNGDDYYEPNTLKSALAAFASQPEAQLVYGDYSVLTQDGRKVAKPKISFDFEICLFFYLMIPQPSSFWRRSLYDSLGGLNAAFNYSFDYDFFLRAGAHLRSRPGAIRHIQDLWSVFRLHSQSKSVSVVAKFVDENERIRGQFSEYKNCLFRGLMTRYQLVRTLRKYHRERGIIPTRKDTSKA